MTLNVSVDVLTVTFLYGFCLRRHLGGSLRDTARSQENNKIRRLHSFSHRRHEQHEMVLNEVVTMVDASIVISWR